MGAHVPVFDIFPHNVRMDLVAQDGRVYFRSYHPNFVSGMTCEHFFFDSLEDLCTFLATKYCNTLDHFHCEKVTIKYDEHYAPERFVMGKYPDDPGEWVLGFVQNINDSDRKDITITMEKV